MVILIIDRVLAFDVTLDVRQLALKRHVPARATNSGPQRLVGMKAVFRDDRQSRQVQNRFETYPRAPGTGAAAVDWRRVSRRSDLSTDGWNPCCFSPDRLAVKAAGAAGSVGRDCIQTAAGEPRLNRL